MLTRSRAVHLLASRPRGTPCVGVTGDLIERVAGHQSGLIEGFANKCGVKTLVWFEQTESIEAAIAREKQTKKRNRAWKIEPIEKSNPGRRDLYADVSR